MVKYTYTISKIINIFSSVFFLTAFLKYFILGHFSVINIEIKLLKVGKVNSIIVAITVNNIKFISDSFSNKSFLLSGKNFAHVLGWCYNIIL